MTPAISTTDSAELTEHINRWMQTNDKKRVPVGIADQLRDLGLKRCSRCTVVQPREKYGTDRARRDNLKPTCHSCNRETEKRWIAANPEKAKAKYRRYYHRHRDECLEQTRRYNEINFIDHRLASARQRAKRFGVRYDMFNAQDLQEHLEAQGLSIDRCAYSGRELTKETAEIEHIVPLSRGGTHTLGNVVIAHRDENRAKDTKLLVHYLADRAEAAAV